MRNALAILISGLILTCGFGCASAPRPTELDHARNALVTRDYLAAESAAQTYIAREPRGDRVAEAYYLKGRALEDQTASSTTDARQKLQQARLAYIEALKSQTADRSLDALIRASLADVAYWQEDFATAAEQGIAAYSGLEQADTKSWTLYRAAIAQQRLGRFDDADKTLAMVQEYHPGTEPAQRAASRVGVRSFNVQVATYTNPAYAQSAVSALQRQGYTASTKQIAGGKTVVFAGPYPTWGQASHARVRLVSSFPDALIVP
jgi:outer membrane protein assembly factor BamD (BamD/ComL family)